MPSHSFCGWDRGICFRFLGSKYPLQLIPPRVAARNLGRGSISAIDRGGGFVGRVAEECVVHLGHYFGNEPAD